MSAEGAGVPAEGVVPAKPSEFMEEQGAEWPRWTLEGGEGRRSAVGHGKDWVDISVGGRSDRFKD